MKKLKLSNLPAHELLSRDQLRNILGGDGSSGGNCENAAGCSSPGDACGVDKKSTCTQVQCISDPQIKFLDCL